MSDEHSDRPNDARRAFLKRMAAVGFAAPLITTFEPVAATAAGEKPGHNQHKHTTEHCKTTTPAPTSTATTTSSTTTAAPTTTKTHVHHDDDVRSGHHRVPDHDRRSRLDGMTRPAVREEPAACRDRVCSRTDTRDIPK